MGSIENISELCRLCLVKDQVNVPIFEENASKEQTFVKINSCLPVKVSRDDSLPKKICDGCSCKLDMLYNFRNTSVDSEKQLLKWLNQADLSCSQSAAKDPLASTKPEIMIKQETFEPTDSRGDDNSDMGMDTHSYLMQQQKLPYPQEFEFGGPSESNVGLMTDEPAPKRAKRAAALNKAPIETDDDDLDAAMQITKAEEEDSEEIDQPDYVEAPSTSADDQPGPSGVGKASVEAPLYSYWLETDNVGDRRSFDKKRAKKGLHFCKICDVEFATTSKLRYHRRQFHRTKDYICAVCNKSCRDSSSLKVHSVSHTDIRKFECKLCGGFFKHKGSLNNHLKLHETSDLQFECKVCGKLFFKKGAFESHMYKHNQIKLTCEVCGKEIVGRTEYKRHKAQHENDYVPPKFPCSMCDKVFNCKSSYLRHIDKHKGVKHLCETCGKSFSTHTHLINHMKIHTGEKPFPCPYCDKKFSINAYLREHILVHTKERPFKCEYCTKGFTQRSSLKLHVRAFHTGEKPYSCHICDRKFISNALLKAHLDGHSKKLD
ncbi:zinc finger protein 2-like isoform X15 [Tribolium madens]|uniref:zinc finger protein 2-like isoform X15 n=1 Tax=Tribolium madens TaxID=41895 RepID=UPI001CF7558E|nr:zinc finger protein 2-like isoform X15 [Tribolium madens]